MPHAELVFQAHIAEKLGGKLNRIRWQLHQRRCVLHSCKGAQHMGPVTLRDMLQPLRHTLALPNFPGKG